MAIAEIGEAPGIQATEFDRPYDRGHGVKKANFESMVADMTANVRRGGTTLGIDSVGVFWSDTQEAPNGA